MTGPISPQVADHARLPRFGRRQPQIAHHFKVVLSALCFTLGLSGATGFLLGSIRIPATSLSSTALLFILSITIVLSAFLWLAIRQFPTIGIRNPIILLFGYLFLAYSLRPLYVFLTSGFGTSRFLQEWRLTEIQHTYEETLLIICCGLSLFATGYLAVPASLFQKQLVVPREFRSHALFFVFVMFLISLGTAVLVASELISSASGWQFALQQRTSFFQGRTVLIVAMSLYKYALFVWIGYTLANNSKPPRRLVFVLVLSWLPTLAFDSLSGGRANLIFFNIIPVFLLVSLIRRPERTDKFFALIGVTISGIVFIIYRALVRDSVTGSHPTSFSTNIRHTIVSFPDYLIGSFEGDIFDGLVFVRMRIPDYIPYRGVANTVEMVLTTLFPSALFPGKLERTSAILTKLLLPVEAGWGGTFAFSSAADLYYAGGPVVLLAGFLLMGMIAGSIVRSLLSAAQLSANTAPLIAFSYFVTGHIVLIIRVDLTNFALLALDLAIFSMFLFFMTRPVRGAAKMTIVS